jgi:transposase
MEQKNKIFIGIDVSKETLDIFMDSHHFKIQNANKAISFFIKKNISDKKIQLCVVESTGGYERLVMSMMQQADISVHRAHPNKVYAFAKAAGHFAKTDKLDAKLLEKYANFVSDTEHDDAPLSQAQIDLQELRSIQRDLANFEQFTESINMFFKKMNAEKYKNHLSTKIC